MRHYHQLVKVLLQQARKQRSALELLTGVFANEAQWLFRHDQAVCLRRLKISILREISNIQEQEIVASNAFTTTTLIMGAAEFALGGLVAAMFRSRRVFSVGVHLAQGELSKVKPFDTVLVTVGHGGLPDDVEVVSLSRLARELNSPESDVEASLQAHGYFLMTPDSFSNLVDELEGRVLHGYLTLPIASKQLRAEWHPADAISQ